MNMRLVSPCQPSLMTVTSMLTMSPFFSGLVVRDAVADLVVDRGADRLRVGRVAGRRVVQRRRNRALHVDDVVVRQLVELVGGDAGLDVRREHVQHLGGQPAGHAHAFDVGGGLDGDRHGPELSHRTRKIAGFRRCARTRAPAFRTARPHRVTATAQAPDCISRAATPCPPSAPRRCCRACRRSTRASRRRVRAMCTGSGATRRWTAARATSWRRCCDYGDRAAPAPRAAR